MVLALILFLFILLVMIAWPVETHSLVSTSNMCKTYEESIDRVAALRSQDGAEIMDSGHTILMAHGHRTQRVVVMYHGYTNSPRQYEKLAQLFFDRGYNVYVPRIPHHGHTNLYTKEIGKLSLHDLMIVCDSSVDIARGLGEEITVLGLSMGGVMASWAAQFRQHVKTAVVIVPSFAWYFLPRVVNLAITMSYVFPNVYLWWDPIKKMTGILRIPCIINFHHVAWGMLCV